MDILHARQGAVTVLRWHRPAKRNAITASMYAAMSDALQAAEDDASVRVIVLGGGDAGFTAGNDLADFVANPPLDGSAPVVRFLQTVSTLRKPLIASVRGAAIGIGTTVLLHCDLVYAGDDAHFAMPFVQLGLCPEAASSLLLPRLLGHQRAAGKLFFGEPFDASEALRMGLVNRVLEAAALEDFVLAQASRLAQLPAAALQASKALLRRDAAEPVAVRMTHEMSTFAALLSGPAAREALQAFAEKRQPDFSLANSAPATSVS